MTNTERIQANNAELRECIELAENLPDKGEGCPETYDGVCVVTPTAEEQILSTAEKVVPSDITIHKIPYAEVSNPAGGVTVIIG